MVATEKQEEIQLRTKHWFDKTSTIRNFQIGDKVHFTPDISNSKKGKLDDSWTGPYEVVSKISPVTYAIDRPDQRRKNAAAHVTAMKKWMPPIADTLFISTSGSSGTPELPNYAIEGGANFPPLADDLTNQQVQDLHTLWKEFPHAIAPKLGREKRAVHRILTGNAIPVRMAPYRVPQIWEERFRAELKNLKRPTDHAVCIRMGCSNVCCSQESPRTNPPS